MANTPLLQPMIDCYRLNRKYFRVPEMGLVTAFCPLTSTGAGETVVQIVGETRFVVDCKVNSTALVGHVKITFASERITASCGGVTGNEMPNTVPAPELPPATSPVQDVAR